MAGQAHRAAESVTQLVSPAVFWQGAVRAIITATPQVSPGKPISITLSVFGANGPITDPSTLNSLTVGSPLAATGCQPPGCRFR